MNSGSFIQLWLKEKGFSRCAQVDVEYLVKNLWHKNDCDSKEKCRQIENKSMEDYFFCLKMEVWKTCRTCSFTSRQKPKKREWEKKSPRTKRNKQKTYIQH